MITLDEALKIVSAHLSRLDHSTGDEPTVVMESETIEKQFGWIFFYNTKKYIETGDFKYMLAGNAPLIVDKDSGKVHETGTAHPIEYYIEEYKKQ